MRKLLIALLVASTATIAPVFADGFHWPWEKGQGYGDHHDNRYPDNHRPDNHRPDNHGGRPGDSHDHDRDHHDHDHGHGF